MKISMIIASCIAVLTWLGIPPEPRTRPDALAREAEHALVKGWTEQALELLGRAIILSPRAPEYRLARADVLARIGHEDGRLRDLHKACDLAPDSTECHWRRGCAFQEFGNLSDAIADFDRALDLSPQRAEIYHARGTAHERLGHRELAERDFARALELIPGSTFMPTARARATIEDDGLPERR